MEILVSVILLGASAVWKDEHDRQVAAADDIIREQVHDFLGYSASSCGRRAMKARTVSM